MQHSIPTAEIGPLGEPMAEYFWTPATEEFGRRRIPLDDVSRCVDHDDCVERGGEYRLGERLTGRHVLR